MDRSRAKRITAAIVGVGLIAAVIVFFTAQPAEEFPLGYDPLTNKKNILELERLGGRANVMAAQLTQWWNGLWHGRTLAGTLVVLTLLVAFAFWVMATLPPLDDHTDHPGSPGSA